MVYLLRVVLVSAYTVFWGALACLVGLFDKSGESLVWIARRWVAWILRTCRVRIEAHGAETLRGLEPVVLMSNHQSLFDIPALVATLPISWRFVAKRELTFVPFLGWALVLGGHIIIDRSRRQRAVTSLGQAAARVAAGLSVIIFPEGTRSADGRLGELKSGGFHLAQRAGVAIVPVVITGSSAIESKGSLRIRSGVMRVAYGAAIATEGRSLAELKADVRAALEAGLAAAAAEPSRSGLAPDTLAAGG